MKRTLAAIALTFLSLSANALTMAELDSALNDAKQAATAINNERMPTLTDKQWERLDNMVNAVNGAESFAFGSNCKPYNSALLDKRRIDVVVLALTFAREKVVAGKVNLDKFKNIAQVIGMATAHFYNCGPEDGSANPNAPASPSRAPNGTRPGTLL
jgi:hypothetical protein